MTMNRVIHGAVCRDLDRFTAALDALPDGDTARAAQLQRAFANLRRELTEHHESEDTYAWPALQKLGADVDLLEAMESEHADMSRALAETDTALSALARTGRRPTRQRRGRAWRGPGRWSTRTSPTRRTTWSRSS